MSKSQSTADLLKELNERLDRIEHTLDLLLAVRSGTYGKRPLRTRRRRPTR